MSGSVLCIPTHTLFHLTLHHRLTMERTEKIGITQWVKPSGSITSDTSVASGTFTEDTDKATADPLWGKTCRSIEELEALGTAVFALITRATDADITDFATVSLRH